MLSDSGNLVLRYFIQLGQHSWFNWNAFKITLSLFRARLVWNQCKHNQKILCNNHSIRWDH